MKQLSRHGKATSRLAALALAASVAMAPPIQAASATWLVRVIDADTQAGIIAEVIVEHNGRTYSAALTNARGEARIKEPCKFGATVSARPDEHVRYLPPATARPCSQPPVVLPLRDRTRPLQLSNAAAQFETDREFGKAALAFNEAFVRSPNKAASDVQVLTNAAKALSVPTEKALRFDVKQGKYVASPDLVAAITKFQNESKLAEDGVLGGETLEALANQKTYRILFPPKRADKSSGFRPP